MHRVCRSYISFLKKISPDNMGNMPSLHNQNPVSKCISSSPRRRFGNGKAYGQVTRSHPQSYNRFPALNHPSSLRLRYHVGWEYDCPVFQVTSMPYQPQHHVRKLRRIHACSSGAVPVLPEVCQWERGGRAAAVPGHQYDDDAVVNASDDVVDGVTGPYRHRNQLERWLASRQAQPSFWFLLCQ